MPDWDRSAGPERDRGAGVFLQVGAGVLLVPVLHLVAGLSLGSLAFALDAVGADGAGARLLRELPIYWLLGIGVAQLPYVAPVALGLWLVRRPLALGVVIGAALTVTLNGACLGLVFSGDLLR